MCLRCICIHLLMVLNILGVEQAASFQSYVNEEKGSDITGVSPEKSHGSQELDSEYMPKIQKNKNKNN